jgi:transposase
MTRAPWIGPASPPRQTASARRSTRWWPPPNRWLLNHLASEREHLFTFLRVPGVQATNWRAEQAIRPAVVTRTSWGGNRTRAGADTWQVLTSVLRTATQQGRDPIELLTRLLQAPTPIVADLAIPGH